VINDKSQDTLGRHLIYCGIFSDNLLQFTVESAYKRIFTVSQRLAKLQARKLSVSLGTVLLTDEELARDLEYGKKQLFLGDRL